MKPFAELAAVRALLVQAVERAMVVATEAELLAMAVVVWARRSQLKRVAAESERAAAVRQRQSAGDDRLVWRCLPYRRVQ